MILSCGCTIHDTDSDNFMATWFEYVCDEYGEHIAQCYGSLCDDCFNYYLEAERCNLGGTINEI